MKTLRDIQDLMKFGIWISPDVTRFLLPAVTKATFSPWELHASDRWGYQPAPRTDAQRPSDAPRICLEFFLGEHRMPHP
jgi:hypothetical protein